MKLFGLIGYPLGHSFSKGYFTEKFQQLGISETHQYEKFEIPSTDLLPALLFENPDLVGLNVTIPHKLNVFQYLTNLDASAQKVGAVNVIKINADKTLTGYNSDYYGFKNSLSAWMEACELSPKKALVLGNGGAAKAIKAALTDLGIEFKVVSRTPAENEINYEAVNETIIASHELIVNCSPLGTYPNIDASPAIPYHLLSANHLLYDLVYNPTETAFMKQGTAFGAKTMNGYEMLVLQAEKSWEIWND